MKNDPGDKKGQKGFAQILDEASAAPEPLERSGRHREAVAERGAFWAILTSPGGHRAFDATEIMQPGQADASSSPFDEADIGTEIVFTELPTVPDRPRALLERGLPPALIAISQGAPRPQRALGGESLVLVLSPTPEDVALDESGASGPQAAGSPEQRRVGVARVLSALSSHRGEPNPNADDAASTGRDLPLAARILRRAEAPRGSADNSRERRPAVPNASAVIRRATPVEGLEVPLELDAELLRELESTEEWPVSSDQTNRDAPNQDAVTGGPDAEIVPDTGDFASPGLGDHLRQAAERLAGSHSHSNGPPRIPVRAGVEPTSISQAGSSPVSSVESPPSQVAKVVAAKADRAPSPPLEGAVDTAKTQSMYASPTVEAPEGLLRPAGSSLTAQEHESLRTASLASRRGASTPDHGRASPVHQARTVEVPRFADRPIDAPSARQLSVHGRATVPDPTRLAEAALNRTVQVFGQAPARGRQSVRHRARPVEASDQASESPHAESPETSGESRGAAHKLDEPSRPSRPPTVPPAPSPPELKQQATAPQGALLAAAQSTAEPGRFGPAPATLAYTPQGTSVPMQNAAELRMWLTERGGQASIELQSADGDRMHVQLRVVDGRADLVVRVPTQLVTTQMEQSLQELQQALERSGVESGSLELRADSQQRGDKQPERAQPERRTPSAEAGNALDSPTADGSVQSNRRPDGSNLVDLIV